MLLADTQGLPSRTANPSPRALLLSPSVFLPLSPPSTPFSPFNAARAAPSECLLPAKKLSKLHHHGLPLIRPQPATQERRFRVHSAS